MMFIQKQILRIVSIALRRANFSQRENLKSVLLPERALPLYPAGGRLGPQTPRLLRGLRPPVPPTHF